VAAVGEAQPVHQAAGEALVAPVAREVEHLLALKISLAVRVLEALRPVWEAVRPVRAADAAEEVAEDEVVAVLAVESGER
jgi:hypothetical protein